jgi:hypothetical protein
MTTFVESLVSKVENKVKGDGKKTPINSLVDDIPQALSNIEEDLEPSIESEIEKEVSPAPRAPRAPMSQSIKDIPNNKTDIGKLINFSEKSDSEASSGQQKKSNSVSRSRSELMNRENVKIPRGKGHESMNSSSLGTDILATKSKESSSNPNIIEDIGGEDEQVISFSPDDTNSQLKNTHKSKQDLKTIAMEMANGRDVVEK